MMDNWCSKQIRSLNRCTANAEKKKSRNFLVPSSAVGKSIFQHDPKGKVAEAYKSLTREVMANAKKQLKRVAERGR